MEWQPIEVYDKMKNKPKYCLFWFEAVLRDRAYTSLEAFADTSRIRGSRVCTHFSVYVPPANMGGEK